MRATIRDQHENGDDAMTTTITRDEVKQATKEPGVTVVEVLDEEHFDEFHLPGAINVPLGDDFDARIRAEVPSKSETVIVYCGDRHCPASAKAAERMQALGYQNVYDYEGGKLDWKHAGLPIAS